MLFLNIKRYIQDYYNFKLQELFASINRNIVL